MQAAYLAVTTSLRGEMFVFCGQRKEGKLVVELADKGANQEVLGPDSEYQCPSHEAMGVFLDMTLGPARNQSLRAGVQVGEWVPLSPPPTFQHLISDMKTAYLSQHHFLALPWPQELSTLSAPSLCQRLGASFQSPWVCFMVCECE